MPLKLLLVLLLTVLSLFWALRDLDPAHAWTAVSAFPPVLLLVIVVVLLAGLIARTIRLRLLIDRPVSFRAMLVVMSVGILAINVTPLRMGELVRPYLLSSRHDVPFGQALAAVGIERLLDLLGLLMLFGLTAWLLPLPEEGLLVGGIDLFGAGLRVVGVGAIVGFAGLLILLVAGEAGMRLVERVVTAVLPLKLAGPLVRFSRSLLEGLQLLARRPSRAVQAVSATVILWASWVVAAWLAMKGFDGIEATLPGAVLNWAATITAVMVVPTPGFLGTFEAGSVASLRVLGAAPSTAQAFAIGYHALTFLFTLTCGLVSLPAVGVGLGETIRRSRGLVGRKDVRPGAERDVGDAGPEPAVTARTP